MQTSPKHTKQANNKQKIFKSTIEQSWVEQ